jgi:hypothetical protein
MHVFGFDDLVFHVFRLQSKCHDIIVNHFTKASLVSRGGTGTQGDQNKDLGCEKDCTHVLAFLVNWDELCQ